MLNRSAVIVRGRQPFVDWLNSLPAPAPVTLADINREPHVYLLPLYGSEEERRDVLSGFFALIFDEELAGWRPNEDDWPVERGPALFNKWFSIETTSIVSDLDTEPPLDEEGANEEGPIEEPG